jgi:hypothetical protein
LNRKLADQKAVVQELTSQVDHAVGDNARRMVQKQEQAVRTAQSIQHDLDATLSRVAYLREAARLAAENLAVMERFIASTRLVDPAKADGMAGKQASTRREIDGINQEIVKLGASAEETRTLKEA